MIENWRARFLDPEGIDVDILESHGETLAFWQRGVNWWIGDLARYAEGKLPDTWQQVFPTWMSPGLAMRCKAVAEAYPNEGDRNLFATWSQHMQVASKPDRMALVAAMVAQGETTDQSRAAAKEPESPRWLLAIDVNYYLHRFWHSGAGVEAADGVDLWIQRTSERLQEKGLTDVVCCFDHPSNHRKPLTHDWDDKYKDRPPKEVELIQQLTIVYELLEGHGFACVRIDGMEADDVMASYAKQFDGRVTLLTQDKDLRQCLSDRCNMLLDVEWTEDESGDVTPAYKWLSAKAHTDATGIPPSQWADYQTLMGDNCDGIKGAIGIGEKGAADLIKQFGSASAALAGAKAEDVRMSHRQQNSLIDFEPKMAVTRQLVTLRTDLDIPRDTRI